MLQEQVSILVVDDEPQICEFLREYLTIKGYMVTTASNGIEALLNVPDQQPRLILLDIRMPKMDGLETLRKVREMDQDICVIMLTAVNDEEIAKQAMREGAYDYLVKPLNLAYLELVILTELARTGKG